jgi:parallel beta-helix repeat protein
MLTAGKLQIGGLPVQAPATAGGHTTTAPPPMPVPRKKGHPVLWFFFILFLLGGVLAGGAVWWGWDHGLKEQYTKIVALIQSKISGVHPKPPVTPEPPEPVKPDSNKDPVVVVNHDPEPIKPEPVKPPDPVKPPEPKPEPVKPPEPKPTTLAGMLAKAKAGDTITVPAGVYEEALIFKEGVNLVANGEVVVQTDGKTGPTLKADGCKEGSIRGFTFLHSGDEVGGKDPWPVALIRSSSIKITDCSFKRSLGDGVQFTGAGSSTLTGCHVDHSTLCGILVERGASPTISNCDVSTSGASGIEVRLTGSNAKLIGNVCNNNIAGIVVKDDGSATVTGETQCKNNKEVGILAVGSGAGTASASDITVLTDSEIDESATYGVYLFGDANSAGLLRGNRCVNSGSSGIMLHGAGFKPVLDTNTSSNNGNVGIYVGEGCGGEIKNNTCRGNKNGGIVVEKGASADLKKENNITD